MIFSFKLHQVQRINVWVDEFPDTRLDGALTAQRKRNASKILSSRAISVEWYIPRGARVIYGLLGFEFSPNHSSTHTISIHEASKRTQYDSIIAPTRIVSPVVGIPVEYNEGIMNAISQYYSTMGEDVPMGELNVKYGAFCPVCSNQWIFERATKFLLTALDNDTELDRTEILNILSSL